MTLRGRSPPGKRSGQGEKDMQKDSSWLDVRQARAIWLITQSQGVSIKFKKTSKTHENEITT